MVIDPLSLFVKSIPFTPIYILIQFLLREFPLTLYGFALRFSLDFLLISRFPPLPGSPFLLNHFGIPPFTLPGTRYPSPFAAVIGLPFQTPPLFILVIFSGFYANSPSLP